MAEEYNITELIPQQNATQIDATQWWATEFNAGRGGLRFP